MTAPAFGFSRDDPSATRPPASGSGDQISLAAGLVRAAIAIAWSLAVFAPLPWPGLNDTAAHWLGVAFGVLGLLLIVSGFGTLIAHRTTYLPHRVSTKLVTSGPFVRFRNPIYLGEALLLLYGAEITQSIWFVAVAFLFGVLVTVLQIIPEERHLEAAFGKEIRPTRLARGAGSDIRAP